MSRYHTHLINTCTFCIVAAPIGQVRASAMGDSAHPDIQKLVQISCRNSRPAQEQQAKPQHVAIAIRS